MVEIDANDLLRMVEETEGPGAASLADVTLRAIAELAVLMKPEARPLGISSEGGPGKEE